MALAGPISWEVKAHQSCSPAPPPSRTHLGAREPGGGGFTALESHLTPIPLGDLCWQDDLPQHPPSPAPHTALRHSVPWPVGSALVVAGDNFLITAEVLGLAAGLQTSLDFCWDCYLHVQLPF